MSEMEKVKTQKEATELYRKSGLSTTIDFNIFLKLFKKFKEENPTLIKSAVAFNGYLGEMLKDPELENKLHTNIILKRASDGNIEEIVKRMVERELSDLEKSRSEVSKSVDPFKHLYPKHYKGKLSEEEEKRKDRWETGVKQLADRQRRLKETGGLLDHIIGRKHQIEMLGEDEQRALPKSNMAELMRPKTPSETKYTDGQKAEFIREMSEQLREVPYRKWDHIQTEFARQFPGISEAVIKEQEKKKRKAVRRV